MELLFSDILHNRGTCFKKAILLIISCHLASLKFFFLNIYLLLIYMYLKPFMNILSQCYERAAQKGTCNLHISQYITAVGMELIICTKQV